MILLPVLRLFRGQMLTLLQAAVYSGALGFALMYLGFNMLAIFPASPSQTARHSFSTLLSIGCWRTNPLARKLGIALAFLGVAVISFDPGALKNVLGLLLVVASQLVIALGLIYIKRLRDISAWQLQAWLGIVSAPSLLLLSFLFESGQMQAISNATWVGWSSLLFTATASSLIAHTMMFHLIAKYPVTSVHR